MYNVFTQVKFMARVNFKNKVFINQIQLRLTVKCNI